jgi:hypothetical protein
MAKTALPVGIEKLSPTSFGGGPSLGQLRCGSACGKSPQRIGGKEPIVTPLELGDPVEFLCFRFNGVLRVLVNRAQSLVLEIAAGFPSIGHEKFCNVVTFLDGWRSPKDRGRPG